MRVTQLCSDLTAPKSRVASDFSPQTRVSQGISAVGSIFPYYNRGENRRALATFDRNESTHLGASKSSNSESASTGVWCVPGFGAGFEIALEPSKLQKEGENRAKGHFYFLRQTLVCNKPWFKRDLSNSL